MYEAAQKLKCHRSPWGDERRAEFGRRDRPGRIYSRWNGGKG
jgi:hypothetical protein